MCPREVAVEIVDVVVLVVVPDVTVRDVNSSREMMPLHHQSHQLLQLLPSHLPHQSPLMPPLLQSQLAQCKVVTDVAHREAVVVNKVAVEDNPLVAVEVVVVLVQQDVDQLVRNQPQKSMTIKTFHLWDNR
jgi:hypothetical protein